MGHRAKKAEHSGPKKGRGAYYGRKADAKHESSKARRKQAEKDLVSELAVADAHKT